MGSLSYQVQPGDVVNITDNQTNTVTSIRVGNKTGRRTNLQFDAPESVRIRVNKSEETKSTDPQ